MPEFPTIAHVTLTVSDLDHSVPWYERLFGATPVLDEDPGGDLQGGDPMVLVLVRDPQGYDGRLDHWK
jgi:catechol 2,3-dioxygenase-like lactoylglutathione lyase family enzyme